MSFPFIGSLCVQIRFRSVDFNAYVWAYVHVRRGLSAENKNGADRSCKSVVQALIETRGEPQYRGGKFGKFGKFV